MGKMSVEWFADGIELGSTPDVTQRLINVLVPRLSEALGATVTGAAAIPGFALGGYASGLALVGERGPELVSLPRGSYVHDNAESERMVGGATNTYNFSVNISGNANAKDVEIGVLRGLRAAGVAI
jgi:hypothetical protein